MATGRTTVDFGSGAPEGNDTQKLVQVTGQTGITSTSFIEAWVELKASVDHTVDEHAIEEFRITAGNVVGTTFDIWVVNTRGKTYGVYNLEWAWV